jgi:hypothetical protein
LTFFLCYERIGSVLLFRKTTTSLPPDEAQSMTEYAVVPGKNTVLLHG